MRLVSFNSSITALVNLSSPSYGPKGEFLINSTIVRILSTEESLEIQLFDTLQTIIDTNPNAFGDYDVTSDLIPLKDFISFILTPLAAAILIEEDKDLTLEEGINMRDDSNRFGDITQPEDDDPDGVIDDLHRANIRAMGSSNPFFSQPPRHRKPALPVCCLLIYGIHIMRLLQSHFPELEPLDVEEKVSSHLLSYYCLMSLQKPIKPKPKFHGGANKTITLDDFTEVRNPKNVSP